mgnify:CR=1 FL=1
MIKNHWALDELKKEIKDMQLHELLKRYIDAQADYNQACQTLVKSFDTDARSYYESRCRHLKEKVLVISLKISEKMTGVAH